jgi:hypothetical protein
MYYEYISEKTLVSPENLSKCVSPKNIMILQLTNIVSGFILSAPKLKELVGGKGAEHIVAAEAKLNTFRGTIGIIELVLGAVALVDRLGILFIGGIGASFPQAFAALACGALLAPHLLEKYPAMKSLVEKMKPYEVWIGLAALAIGLGSMLFGCISPICYSF